MASAWSGTGRHGGLLWGACSGSAATPYRTYARLDGFASRCTCPSRKRPCKHVLALLLLGVDDLVHDQPEVPDDVAAWQADPPREARPARGTLADPAAAAARAAQRAERVRLGLEELDVWLSDQVRGGLAALQRAGYGPVDQVAARMVDAQAPGVASMLRALPARYVGADWPARTLEHLALVRLLVAAHRRSTTCRRPSRSPCGPGSATRLPRSRCSPGRRSATAGRCSGTSTCRTTRSSPGGCGCAGRPPAAGCCC